MSLFGSIQLAGNTLRSNEIALQVIGQNIANANTPGYIREDVDLVPAAAQRQGGLVLGLGVRVRAVVQKIDLFLEQRLRGAVSDQGGSDIVQRTYSQLEGLLGELGESDLSTAMNEFFGSIAEILNQPESRSVRNLAMLQGDALSQSIRRLADRATSLQLDQNKRIQEMGGEINSLVEEIRTLNIRIAETEGGDISGSDAVGLRDQRLTALESLSRLIDIRAVEQLSGGVTVYCGGDFLVFDGVARRVEVVVDSETNKADIHLASTDAALNPAAGQLRGLLDSRDQVLGGFLEQLDEFTATLIFEFNKVYASGQGLTGFNKVDSTFKVDSTNKPLNQAGLPFTPQNGTFQVLIYNQQTKLSTTHDIRVDLNGIGNDDTTLTGLAAALNAIDGLNAQITADRGLVLTAASADQQFAFANDTSNVLAALGINTFFSGSSARDIAVNSVVRKDPSLFAASRTGIGADTNVAIDLAAFLDRPLATQNGDSIGVLYTRLTAEVTHGSAIAQAEAAGSNIFEMTLRGQKLAISGVNIDEEALKMIAFQRSYQASARYISVLSQLMELLVNL
jgi:flagellar hook-associated protein 1 FlgK